MHNLAAICVLCPLTQYNYGWVGRSVVAGRLVGTIGVTGSACLLFLLSLRLEETRSVTDSLFKAFGITPNLVNAISSNCWFGWPQGLDVPQITQHIYVASIIGVTSLDYRRG